MVYTNIKVFEQELRVRVAWLNYPTLTVKEMRNVDQYYDIYGILHGVWDWDTMTGKIG